MFIERQLGPEGMRQTEAFFRRAGITIEQVTLDHGELARQAFLDFGKGRHKAGLNFGDCFSYALAPATDEPLLFKGNDFALTDIEAAASCARCTTRSKAPSPSRRISPSMAWSMEMRRCIGASVSSSTAQLRAT